ncbi:MAG TPA: thioesterase family protein [Longimicrobiales bacterium]|nr:thioesterase family protein [Longimicrobiales bacterium]
MTPDGGEAFPYHDRVEVRFRDLDPMGHAHHSLPLMYFEEARAAAWRELVGPSLGAIHYIMAEVTVRFHARIRYPAMLDVGVRLARLGEKSWTLEYELRDEAGELLASGSTVQVMYDYAASRTRPVPPAVRAALERLRGSGDE